MDTVAIILREEAMSRLHLMPVLILATAWLAVSPCATAEDGDFYADARVARLADVDGEVSMLPAGGEQWGEAYRNRPLIAGDRLVTGPRGRAAMQLGDAAVRVDDGSAIEFLSLDARLVQIELSDGTLNLRVHEMYGDQIYELDTPTLAFVAEEPGSYRIDVARGGYGAMVTVFDGHGTVYGSDGESRRVYAGRTYRFDDSRLARVDVDNIPRGDDFDRWCAALDRGHADSASSRHVAGNVIGYRDLDRYGNWDVSIRYGSIWYPRHVNAGWRPYHDGRWAWVAPWGWTWVDNAPWGFAPFHYGRWAYVGSRWGWIPGPRHHRAVYAPALVGFIGGSNWSLSIGLGNVHPVGWFPLGPRDLYLPPYHVDRNYFRSVNITNVRVVNRTVINNFYDDYRDHRVADRRTFMYLNNPHAVTVVSRDVFTSAGSVARSAKAVSERALSRVSMARSPQVAPRVASLGVSPRGRPPVLASKAFTSKVVTRHAPRARPVAFTTRQALLAKQDGEPLSVAQRRDLRENNAIVARSAAHSAPRGRPATVKRTSSVTHADTGARGGRAVLATREHSPRTAPQSARDTPHVSTSRISKPRGAPSRTVRAPRIERTQSAATRQPHSRARQPARKSSVVVDRAPPRSRPSSIVRAPVSRSHARSRIAAVEDSLVPTPRSRPAPRVVRQRAPERATSHAPSQVTHAMPRSAPSQVAQRPIESRRPASSRPARAIIRPTPPHASQQPSVVRTQSRRDSNTASVRSDASTSKSDNRRQAGSPRGAPRSRRDN